MASNAVPSVAVEVGFAANPLDALSSVAWTLIHDSTTAAERRALDIATRGGRNHEMGSFEAGVAAILLDNTDRRFDPTYTAGPYGANVKPWRRVRIRAHRGYAVDFDGTNDYAISGAAVVNPGSTSFTAECWFQLDTTASQQTIMSQRNGTGTGRSWIFTSGATGLLCTNIGNVGAAGLTTKVLATGVWYHAAVVYDRAAATVCLYLDGVLVLGPVACTGEACDGQAVVAADKNLGNCANGRIDEVRIWSTARTASQVRANYRKELAGTESGLAASWNLDEGTGTTPQDATAGNNDLTLTNGPTWVGGINTRPYYLFTGFATSWTVSYEGPGLSTVRLEAFDPLAMLSRLTPTLTPYSKMIVDDVPYLYWRLGETIGGTASDLSGNARDGTYSAAAVLGREGMLVNDNNHSIQLIPNGYVDGGAVLSIERTQAFTIECWFNAGDAQQAAQVLIGKYDPATGPNRGIRLALDGFGFIDLLIQNGTGNRIAVVAGTPVTDSTDHHLMVTYDGSSTGAGVKMYKDGIEISTSIGEDTLSATIINAGTFRVGGTISSQIQDVAIYTSVLTAAQALEHYQMGRTPWDGQWAGERAAALLALGGIPAADTFLDRGTATFAPQQQLSGLLSELREVAASELGGFYALGDGRLRLSGRYANIANSVVWKTWGDDGTELDYLDFARVDDDTDLWAEIHATAQNGAKQIAKTAASITTYGPGHVKEVTGLWRDDNQAAGVAAKLLNRYDTPKMRLESLKLRPLSDADFIAVLGTDLHEERITVKKRPVGGGTITQDCWVESISHHISDVQWDTTFGLVPADDAVTNYLTLDATALNSGVVLAY